MSQATALGGYRRYARDVSRRFFVLAVLLPLGAGLVAIGSGDLRVLNLVHVTAGAAWAGATIYLAGVLSPALQALEPPVRPQVTVPLIPKHVLLFSALIVVTLLTGVALAGVMGRDDTAPVMAAAYAVGLLLLAIGLYLVRLQALIYREFDGGDPDVARVGALAVRLGKAGVIGAVLQVAALVVMALLRFA